MFSKIFSKNERPEVAWVPLESIGQLDELDAASANQPAVIFKHSTRCSISSMSLGRFERSYKEGVSFTAYYLDLISYRDLSAAIAERYGVMHESPQVILVKDGKAIHNASHTGISYEELEELAQNS